MLRRWLARCAVVLALVTGGVAVGTAAQAWSYCSNGSLPGASAIFWHSQGYCPANSGYSWTNLNIGVCHTMAGHPWNDYAAAVYNTRPWTLTLFQADNCSFSYEWHDICANCSDPDLYPDRLYRNISSFKWS